MPVTRLELVHSYLRQILSLLRLPFRHTGSQLHQYPGNRSGTKIPIKAEEWFPT